MNLRKKNLSVYLYLIIPLAIYITFFIIPNIQTFVYSVFRWDGVNPVKEFVGLKNFLRLFKDSVFYKSAIHTLVYTISLIIGENVVAIILAVLLYKKSRTNLFFKIIMFLPAIFSSVATGIIWMFIYGSTAGVANKIFDIIGLSGLKILWLTDPRIAIFTVVSVHIWIGIGYSMILFIAGLQNVPEEIYEAAKVDGVNLWQNFIHVTIPMLKSTIAVVLVLATISGFTAFDFVFVMTGGGLNASSEVIATYLYKQGFQYSNVGYSSAMAVMLVFIVLIVSIVQLRAMREY